METGQVWFTLVEIRVRADRESERAGRAMDRYVYLHIHTDGRRLAVTWMVTTTECVPSREDHP